MILPQYHMPSSNITLHPDRLHSENSSHPPPPFLLFNLRHKGYLYLVIYTHNTLTFVCSLIGIMECWDVLELKKNLSDLILSLRVITGENPGGQTFVLLFVVRSRGEKIIQLRYCVWTHEGSQEQKQHLLALFFSNQTGPDFLESSQNCCWTDEWLLPPTFSRYIPWSPVPAGDRKN